MRALWCYFYSNQNFLLTERTRIKKFRDIVWITAITIQNMFPYMFYRDSLSKKLMIKNNCKGKLCWLEPSCLQRVFWYLHSISIFFFASFPCLSFSLSACLPCYDQCVFAISLFRFALSFPFWCTYRQNNCRVTRRHASFIHSLSSLLGKTLFITQFSHFMAFYGNLWRFL